MNFEDYTNQLSMLNKKHEHELRKLASLFAKANNKIKVNDIIKDSIGHIRVESFHTFISPLNNKKPMIRYFGTCITIKGKVFKSGEKRSVFQCNIIN